VTTAPGLYHPFLPYAYSLLLCLPNRENQIQD
jgi:hypothetical protein